MAIALTSPPHLSSHVPTPYHLQLAGVDGSGAFTMRFRVNGANVWSRGSNWIEAEVLEGR